MENSSPLIVDISSDEEADLRETGKDGGSSEFGDVDYFDWFISSMLDERSGNKDVAHDDDDDDDDDDDVVFVSEVLPKPPKKSRIESLKPKNVDNECGDDDDCLILDGDPDKPVVVVNGRVDDVNDDDNDSDDVAIVGEKGEVACRDFPHARHLCVKFLFASTPHEVHCGQCHCYVCDSLAPCSHWGTGTSISDHCHASDKEEYWKAQRKSTRKVDNNNNSNNINKPAPFIPSRNNGACFFERLLQSTEFPPVSSTIQRRSISSSNAHAPSVADRSRSARRGIINAPPSNKRSSFSQVSRSPPILKRCRTFMSSVSNSGTHMAQSVSPRPYSTGLIREPIHRQSQTGFSQQYVSRDLVNPVASQPSLENLENMNLSQPRVVFHHSVAGNAFGNEIQSRSVVSSGINSYNQSSQPQPYNNDNPTSSLLIDGQNSLETIGFDWDSSSSNGNLQIPPPPEVSELQNDNSHNVRLQTANNSDSQFLESTKSDLVDFPFDRWLFENQTFSGALGAPPSPPGWNVYSPESASIDAVNLFDI